MTNQNVKMKRSIMMKSIKNGQPVTLFSPFAKAVALMLENSEQVLQYETHVPLNAPYQDIDVSGIRGVTLGYAWASDFRVHLLDGRTGILEIGSKKKLESSLSHAEQLELSRRYWKSKVSFWCVLLDEREK